MNGDTIPVELADIALKDERKKVKDRDMQLEAATELIGKQRDQLAALNKVCDERDENNRENTIQIRALEKLLKVYLP